jgi:trehalose-6-phosphatase
MVSEVIFDEAYYRGRALHVLEKNSGMNEVKINVFELQIKVVKQIFKSSPNRETIMHLIGDDIKDTEVFDPYSAKSQVELKIGKAIAKVIANDL